MTKFVLALTVAFWLSPQQSATTDLSAQFQRAVTLQQQGKFAEAADEYRSLLKRKPDYVEAQANLGAVLSRLGKYEEAVAAYTTALRLAPQLTQIRLNLGIAHYRAGQMSQAVEVLQKFLVQTPNSIQARQLYGLSLAALGRDAEAIEQLTPTLDTAPADAAVLYTLGLSQLRAGKAGFRATLERLAAFPAGLPALHLLQGQAFLRDLEFEQALEELNEAKKLNADLPRLHYALGLAHLKLAHNQEALTCFTEEAKRSPRDYLTLYHLAFTLEATDQLDAALDRVNVALQLDPQSTEANALLSKILSRQGKNAEALPPLEQAVAKDPADPVKRYMLARLYRQLGRTEEANRQFAEVQRLKAEQLKNDRARTPKP
ncbi:MAG TPA: tetratricopeptide repeat protein [Blastocatellia bacterium]|nr:tetratricopeptide repeat protein [Blastocatellia bacterium]